MTITSVNEDLLFCLQMESVIRHCYVKNPKEFEKARNDGDDVFLCEYEYDIHWHSFKRIAEIEDNDVVCSKKNLMIFCGTFVYM